MLERKIGKQTSPLLAGRDKSIRFNQLKEQLAHTSAIYAH